MFGVVELFALTGLPLRLAVAEGLPEGKSRAGPHRKVMRRSGPQGRMIAEGVECFPSAVGNPQPGKYAEGLQRLPKLRQYLRLELISRETRGQGVDGRQKLDRCAKHLHAAVHGETLISKT